MNLSAHARHIFLNFFLPFVSLILNDTYGDQDIEQENEKLDTHNRRRREVRGGVILTCQIKNLMSNILFGLVFFVLFTSILA